MNGSDTAQLASIPAGARSSERGKRVLVVDDDRDIRESLVELFESEGYEVACAADGRQALVAARRRTPDVILLDQVMPVMCGREFRAEQVLDPSLADIPVVGISASASNFSGSAFLRKPFEIAEVLAIVHRLAGERNRPRSSAASGASQDSRVVALGQWQGARAAPDGAVDRGTRGAQPLAGNPGAARPSASPP